MHYPLLSLKKMDPAMLLFELNSVTARMSEEDARMVTSAAELATYLHRNQRRSVRDDMPAVPYIEHPLRNALRLARWGSRDAELMSIALLHDVIEDCARDLCEMHGINTMFDSTRTAQIESVKILGNLYGYRISEGVAMLTNDLYDDDSTYVEHIANSIHNHDFALVKASDLHDNAGSLIHQVGHIAPTTMRKRLDKYTPAVEIMIDHFLAQPTGNKVIDNASRAMNKLAHTLEQLNTQFALA